MLWEIFVDLLMQLGGVRTFGCIRCAIHVKVCLNCGYGVECVVCCVLVQLLHMSWMKEVMLTICYNFMHIMIDDDSSNEILLTVK